MTNIDTPPLPGPRSGCFKAPSDMKLTRTQTIMQGASECDFRYTRIKPKEGSDAA